MDAGPVLLFDGVCGLCNGTVRVVLQLDGRARIRFAPLEGRFAADVLARRPELRSVDSLILVEPLVDTELVVDTEGVSVKSDAILRLAHHLGGVWRSAAVMRIVPRVIRDWAYDVVARHRYALFGRYVRRPPPPAGTEARFLD